MKPPLPNEIEVSVFGPGYGESILVHLGDNKWLLMDSCLNPNSREPYAVSYLSNLGLNPEEVIKYIVASHWHDDHIKGLSNIVDQCDNAEFICSDAIRKNEFVSLVDLYSGPTMMRGSGIDEFCRIFHTLETKSKHPKLAVANRPLIHFQHTGNCLELDCTIYSLSPSDYAVYQALKDLSNLLPTTKSSKNKIVDFSPNHTSVVLLIVIDDIAILLGADLQELGIPETGWINIINSGERPSIKACLYKIPHHGSHNGDHPDIWNQLLETKFSAVVTPWETAGNSLPKDTDIDRIKTRATGNKAYLTSSPLWKKSKRSDRAVQRTINESGIKIKRLNKMEGHVRFRMDLSQKSKEWKVELLGQAIEL